MITMMVEVFILHKRYGIIKVSIVLGNNSGGLDVSFLIVPIQVLFLVIKTNV